MSTALIGCTGFVGGRLSRDTKFDFLAHRSNIELLANKRFTQIVCAGLPAAKWVANNHPQEDLENTLRLESVLSTVSADRFILISTIDVYPRTVDADEGFDCEAYANHAYGSNRLRFEKFVRARFPNANIVRLPALFGEGLRKNVLYDLLNKNQLDHINPASRFQWYPLARLSADLRLIELRGLPLVNLFTEPLLTARIISKWFSNLEIGQSPSPEANYDLTTQYGKFFGGDNRYAMTAGAVLDSLGEYLERETARR